MDHRLLFDQLDSILKEQRRPEEEIEKIRAAYDFAAKLHEGQYRVSEEPYIVILLK